MKLALISEGLATDSEGTSRNARAWKFRVRPLHREASMN